MPVEQGTVLLLEGLVAVMLPLSLDVTNYVRELGLADGEGAAAILPGEGVSVEGFVEPKTRPAFE